MWSHASVLLTPAHGLAAIANSWVTCAVKQLNEVNKDLLH